MTTEWTVMTDEEATAERRHSTINDRYQVCHPSEGFIDCARTLADAIDIAERYAARTMHDGKPYCTTPFEIEIYDRMARNGRPRTWRRINRKALVSYCMELGDKFVMDQSALWKVIERRGVKRTGDDFNHRLFA